VEVPENKKDIFGIQLQLGAYYTLTNDNGLTAAPTDGTPLRLPWWRKQKKAKVFQEVIAGGDNSTDRSTYGPLITFAKPIGAKKMREASRLANGLVPIRTRRPCTTLFRWANLMSTSRSIK